MYLVGHIGVTSFNGCIDNSTVHFQKVKWCGVCARAGDSSSRLLQRPGRAGPVREDRDLRCVSVCARAGRPAFLFRFLFLPLSLSLLLFSSLSFLPPARPDSRAAGPVAPPFYQLALTQPEARGPCAIGCDVGSKEAVGWHRGAGSRR